MSVAVPRAVSELAVRQLIYVCDRPDYTVVVLFVDPMEKYNDVAKVSYEGAVVRVARR